MDIISYSEAKKAQKMAGNIGSKKTILTDLKNKDIVHYDEINDVFINSKNKAIVEQWKANHEYEEGELFVFDQMLWVSLKDHKSDNSDSPDLDEVNGKSMPFAKDKGLPNLINLEYQILNDGENIKVTWVNPIADSFEGREIYYSSTLDITTMRYEDIIEGISNGLDIQILTTGLGTDKGKDDTATISNATLRTYYYIKGFAKHIHPETMQEVGTSGRYILAPNPDLKPPSPPVVLNAVVENGSVKLNWQQPSDTDFFYTKIVRSRMGMPTLPTQGTVIDTVSGNVGYYKDDTIKAGVKYYYKLFAYDDAGKDGMQYGQEGNWSSDISAEAEVEWVATLGYDINTNQRIEDAIGLEQSDFDDYYPYSDIARCVVDNNGNVVYYLDEDDSAIQEDGISPSKLDGTDGQVVVELPEFYYSKDNGQFKVSKETFNGATKFERTYIGFSEASEDNVNNKLQSVVGNQPIKLKSLTELRAMASNVGSNWQLADYKTRDVLKMLFAIEYGGLNSQTLIGNGIVSDSGVKDTGKTISLGNKTGIGQDGAISYRGIENLWGNIDEIVEGLVVTDSSYYIADSNYGSFVDDSNKGSYVATGVVPIVSDGYISKLDISGNIVGSETLGNNIDFVGDHQYSHKTGEINIVAQGGNYQDGDKAGLFRSHMGLNPFGKEAEMSMADEFDKVYNGQTTEVEEEFDFEHEDEYVEGNHYVCQLPLFTDDEDFDSLIKIAIS